MAFPDPENYSLEGEVTQSSVITYSQTCTAVDPYIPSSPPPVIEYSLEGSLVQRLSTSTPGSGGEDCDTRPDTGMLYPRG